MYTKTFKQLDKNSVSQAGGKGASLAEMTKAGIPVPPGFVILADTFDHFLNETSIADLIEASLAKVKIKDVNSIEMASAKIKEIIMEAAMPTDIEKEILAEYKKLKVPLVAVRSSATAEDSSAASWAGELETYLNTTKVTILENVKKCWASLFTTRAIFYRFEKKLHTTKVSVAVVVQAMIQSEVSGICFTVHPVTQDYGQMIIEAGFGLGEAIVGGLITPDSYVVHKKGHGYNKLTIIENNISSQEMMLVKDIKGGIKELKVSSSKQDRQKLTSQDILKLAIICENIEKHYGFPCDIEWAFYNKKFYIVQSRPITTLNS